MTSDTPLHFIVAAHAVKIQKLCLFEKDIYKKALFCHFVIHCPRVRWHLCLHAVWSWTFHPFCFSINLWNCGRNALCLSVFCVFIPCYMVLCVLSFCFSINLLKSDRNVSCLSILWASSAGCRHAGLKLQCFLSVGLYDFIPCVAWSWTYHPFLLFNNLLKSGSELCICYLCPFTQ